MARIGYARVSTPDQQPQTQIEALTAAGSERVFTDHGVRGTKASRPELDACLAYLRRGDTLTVWQPRGAESLAAGRPASSWCPGNAPRGGTRCRTATKRGS